MNKQTTEPDVSTWFSTYGFLTAERLLERFKVHLHHDELVTAVKNPLSVYYLLLRVPLKNIFNGIILQQACDYQIYAQKLFIDYSLSEDSVQPEESPGAGTRERLEEMREQLVALNEAFQNEELVHQKLIARSQAQLIEVSKELQASLHTVSKTMDKTLRINGIVKEDPMIQQAVRAAMVHYNKMDERMLSSSSPFWDKLSEVLDSPLDETLRRQLESALTPFQDPREEIENILATYLQQTSDVAIALRGFRSQFYELILQVTELVKLLPDYRPNPIKEAENRIPLEFDAQIGETQ